MERPVRDGSPSGTLGRDTACRESDFFGFCVTDDRESNSPIIEGNPSVAIPTLHRSTAHLNFVLWTRVLYGLRTNKPVSYFRAWRSFWATSGGNGYVACVWMVSNTKFAVWFVSRALGKATE